MLVPPNLSQDIERGNGCHVSPLNTAAEDGREPMRTASISRFGATEFFRVFGLDEWRDYWGLGEVRIYIGDYRGVNG